MHGVRRREPRRRVHYYRRPPVGYARTLATGRNVIRDEGLARYYDVIHRITHDPVFDPARLATVWRFQLGPYEHLLRTSREDSRREPAG